MSSSVSLYSCNSGGFFLEVLDNKSQGIKVISVRGELSVNEQIFLDVHNKNEKCEKSSYHICKGW